jgi:hypothetical protein
MFQRLRNPEPFGKAGLTVAVIALVLAMVGGAYAAGKLTSTQKKEVTAIAKKFAGKPGPAGPQGPAGPAGAAGKAGANGANGTNGTNGKSVEVIPSSGGAGEPCEGKGGAEVKQEAAGSGAEVCNGQTGFTEALPSGKTETGEWSLVNLAKESVGVASISAVGFNIPLATAPTPHYVNANNKEFFHEGSELKERASTACTGTFAAPTAEAGDLCVYASYESGNNRSAQFIENGIILPGICSVANSNTGAGSCALEPLFKGSQSADKVGFAIATQPENNAQTTTDYGSWAVTAE